MAGVILYLALHFALELAVPSRFGDAHRHPGGFLLAAAIDGVLLASIPLLFILRIYSEPLSTFGLSTQRLAVFTLAGVAVGIALTGAAVAYAQVLGWLGSYSQNPYIGLFSEAHSAALRTSIIVVVVLVAPIAEEIFFRAFVFSVVRFASSTKLAVAMSSTLFALAHFSIEWFALNCLVGIVLAVLLQRTGTLIAPIAGHMAFNAIGLALSVAFGEGPEELLPPAKL